MHQISKIILGSLALVAAINATIAKPQLIHPKYRKHPSHTEKIYPEKLNIYGYVDAAYNYLSNRNRFISNEYNRTFDRKPNGVTLNQASVTLEYAPPGLGFLINPVLGSEADMIAPYGIRPYTQAKSHTFAVDIAQALLQYKYDNLSLYAGRFYTLGGRESVNTTINTNYSRSILLLTGPDFVLGLRSIYKFNDQIKMIIGLNNGWDNVRDYNRRPTVELGGAYIFNEKFEVEAGFYSGEERTAFFINKGPKSTRHMLDILGSYHLTDNLKTSLNYNFMKQSKAQLPSFNEIAAPNYGKAVWHGWAGYVDYKFTPNLKLSVRGEIFLDQDGFFTKIKQNWQEVTLTLGYHPFKNVELRAETRRDFSNKKAFVNSKNRPQHHQQSFALQGYVAFAEAFSV